MSEFLLHLHAINRTYKTGAESLTVLDGAELFLQRGEIVALVAPSGSGKSTLLHLAGLLEKPDGGAVIINGNDAGKLPDNARTEIRLRTIGIVYQFHHLLAEFTALENISLPQMIAGKTQVQANIRSMELLTKFGLAARAQHLPGKLSGGEQQRVALARALVNNPRLLLADEPTGDLDETTSGRVFDLIERLHASHGLTSILVTHNLDLAARCTRALRLEGGRLAPLAASPQTGLQAGII